MTYQYIDAFLKLNCATDILDVVNPITKASKEISEAYTMVQALRTIIYPGYSHFYEVLNLCAGNGLLGVTIAHLFNYKYVTSLDIRVPKRKWNDIRKFSYFHANIHQMKLQDVEDKVLVANCPCQRAKTIVEYFCKFNAKALVLMPCCKGQLESWPQMISKKLGKYGALCADLYDDIMEYKARTGETIKVNMYEDTNCLSPKNIVITAIRGGSTGEGAYVQPEEKPNKRVGVKAACCTG